MQNENIIFQKMSEVFSLAHSGMGKRVSRNTWKESVCSCFRFSKIIGVKVVSNAGNVNLFDAIFSWRVEIRFLYAVASIYFSVFLHRFAAHLSGQYKIQNLCKMYKKENVSNKDVIEREKNGKERKNANEHTSILNIPSMHSHRERGILQHKWNGVVTSYAE